jgi:Mrp family chromosome partitioning ATPase
VGLLDVDLCGPSVPKLMGLEGRSMLTAPGGWLPVYAGEGEQFPVVSIGFLSGDDRDAPVIWRGPKKNAVIKSFLEDVRWGDLDVLVVDTPPGTSDEHISTVEYLMAADSGSTDTKVDGAVLVTTPQNVSVNDVRKELTFCKKIGLPILGVFENMSGYMCSCGVCTNVFSSEGGRLLAEQTGVPFLGKIPIDPFVCQCEETGTNPFKTPTPPKSLDVLVNFAKSFLP